MKTRRMRRERHVARIAENRMQHAACRTLVRNPEGKRPQGRVIGGKII
jgi:hypothetical protein